MRYVRFLFYLEYGILMEVKKNYIIILKNKKVKLSNFNRIGDI